MRALAIAAAIPLAAFPTAALAAPPDPALADPALADLAAEVARLRRQVAELEGRLTPPAPAPTPTPLAPPASSPPPAPPAPAIVEAPLPDRRSLPDNVGSAPLDLAVQDPHLTTAFQLTGGAGDTRAELLLQSVVSRPHLGGATEGVGTNTTIAVIASAPLGDGSRTDLATLDGFADDFTLKLRYTSFNVRIGLPTALAVERDFVERAARECRRQHPHAADIDKLCATDRNQNLLIRTYLPEEYPTYLSGRFPPAAAWGIGFEASLGYRQFGFLDPASLAKGSAKRWSAGAKLFGAYYPADGRTALTASAAWERGYEAGAEAAICLGAATPGICPLAVIGPPARKDRAVFSLGLRQRVASPGFIVPRFALAPSVNYEAKDDVWGFDLPVYLVTDGDRALTGGLRLGYVTGKGEDDLVFGLFVGAAFSLFQ